MTLTLQGPSILSHGKIYASPYGMWQTLWYSSANLMREMTSVHLPRHKRITFIQTFSMAAKNRWQFFRRRAFLWESHLPVTILDKIWRRCYMCSLEEARAGQPAAAATFYELCRLNKSYNSEQRVMVQQNGKILLDICPPKSIWFLNRAILLPHTIKDEVSVIKFLS